MKKVFFTLAAILFFAVYASGQPDIPGARVELYLLGGKLIVVNENPSLFPGQEITFSGTNLPDTPKEFSLVFKRDPTSAGSGGPTTFQSKKKIIKITVSGDFYDSFDIPYSVYYGNQSVDPRIRIIEF